MNNSPPILIVTAILIALRALFNNNSQLVLIVAVLNLCALLLVITSIISHAKHIIKDKVNTSGVPKDIRTREENKTYRQLNWTYVPLVFIFLVYIIFLNSELGNDIISIIALGISLADSSIAHFIANLYMKE